MRTSRSRRHKGRSPQAVNRESGRKRRSSIVGPVTAIVLGSASSMPGSFDLAVMTLLFKDERATV